MLNIKIFEENGLLLVFAVLLILVFVYFIIKRNRKDQKDYEKELNQSEMNTEKHEEPKI